MTTITRSAPTVSAAPDQLRRIWYAHARRQVGSWLLPLLSTAVLVAVVLLRWPAARWPVGLGAGVGLLVMLWWLRRQWQPNLPGLARRLDRQFPVLEDSTGLLLRPARELNLLEQLQQARTAAALADLQQVREPLLPVRYRPAGLLAGAGLLVAVGLWLLPTPGATPAVAAPVAVHFSENQPTTPGQPPAPRIVETRVLVQPPAYTRRPAYAAAEPSFRCPQGARVRWTVRVEHPGPASPQLELGRQRVSFRPVTGQPGTYVAEQVLNASVLYRLRLAGRTSDDYAIEVQADEAPVVQIQTPKPFTLVEFGTRPQVNVRVAVRDDYGLSRARLVATVAQGQGEAVKFREVVTELSGGLGAQPTQATLAHVLNLPKLGLTYGDEVYFYVQAWDNACHVTRSDTYLVQWEDTTVNDSNMDMSLGVNVVPAYFRSQRQLIIDTEKLLAERQGLTTEAFTDRANALGFDQKVLRLRYGKFLGEEFEQSIGEAARPPIAEEKDDHDHDAAGGHDHASEAGPDHDHDHAHAAPPTADASPTAATDALLDRYVHHHDDAETADFLEPAVKAKLRGVLSQMWEAELRLRTARPAEALPFENRALRLLKQVQQQTRAYVRKAGFTPPPVPEATTRLTGDLTQATAPRRQQQLPASGAPTAIPEALRVLARLRTDPAGQPADAAGLERVGAALSQAALRRPGAYLTALRDLRQAATDLRARRPVCAPCLPAIERALTDLLPAAPPTPARPPGPGRLAHRYFEELSR